MDGVDPNLPTLDRWIQGGGQAPSLFVGKIWLITRGRGGNKTGSECPTDFHMSHVKSTFIPLDKLPGIQTSCI